MVPFRAHIDAQAAGPPPFSSRGLRRRESSVRRHRADPARSTKPALSTARFCRNGRYTLDARHVSSQGPRDRPPGSVGCSLIDRGRPREGSMSAALSLSCNRLLADVLPCDRLHDDSTPRGRARKGRCFSGSGCFFWITRRRCRCMAQPLGHAGRSRQGSDGPRLVQRKKSERPVGRSGTLYGDMAPEIRQPESGACGSPPPRAYRPYRRCGRVAEGGGLLNRYRVVKPYRGFESLRLRHITIYCPTTAPSHARRPIGTTRISRRRVTRP